MDILFWGTRGSMPCSGGEYIKYGGNTSCVSCEIDGILIIFDAGTGLQNLSEYIYKKGYKEAHLFLTHFHLDHIMGFPFLSQNREPDFTLHLYNGSLKKYTGLKKSLYSFIAPPLIPFTPDDFTCTHVYHDFQPGDPLSITEHIHMETFELNHPNGSMGYKLASRGKSICYITDTEYESKTVNVDFLNFIKYSDLVIFDAAYSDEEFENYKGWGHSTWQQAIKICQKAGAMQLALYHHAPHHTDTILDQIDREAKAMWDKVITSRDGLKIKL